jgi:hypothetical protein
MAASRLRARADPDARGDMWNGIINLLVDTNLMISQEILKDYSLDSP